MKPRICVCCGEAIRHEEGTVAAKYDHLCFSCTHLFEEFAEDDRIAQRQSLRQPAYWQHFDESAL
jgi:hypothetical protein